MRPWFLYILQSQVHGKLYTGITIDIDRRLREHNGHGNKGAKFTRVGRPWVIVHIEKLPSRQDAMKRELAVKRLSRAAKLKLSGTSTLPPASDPCSGSGTG